MNVLNVVAMLDARMGGGTAERTFQMSRHLARHGASCTVLALDTGLPPERLASLLPARAVFLPIAWSRFQVPWPKLGEIRRLVAEADVVHLMGHWSVLNALVYGFARQLGKPYAVCPAGALPIFGRSGLLKWLYNAMVGYALIRNASAWIAVTEGEFPAFEAYGIGSKRITVIPNGVDAGDFHVNREPRDEMSPWDSSSYLLFMGRLNPIKGPDLLLAAFVKVAAIYPDVHLVFAGPDEGMLDSLRGTVSRQGLADRVHFAGRVDGMSKTLLYRGASLLVVPSHHEAMSVVALEAGICGVPVLLTDQCGFSEVKAVDSRLEVPATAEGLAQGLAALLDDRPALEAIGKKMQGFVEGRFAWGAIVSDYLRLYEPIVQRGSRQ